MREKEIERLICDYLAAKKYFYWKQPTVGVFDQKRGRFRLSRNPHLKRGIPDIIIVDRGQFIGLEVKAEKGRQSDFQKAFEADCKRNGGKYYVVKSLEEVKDVLKLCSTSSEG